MNGQESKWLTPQMALGCLGMLGAIAGAWMSFDNRISRVEGGYETTKQQYDSTSARLNRIEDKLDRLIERGTE
jgi:hypothetical protein